MASLFVVPESAAVCKNCAECVLFILANERARHLAEAAKHRLKGNSYKGTIRKHLTRRLLNEFSSFGDESLWAEVVDGMCKGGVIENVNSQLSNVQPQYLLSPSVRDVLLPASKPQTLKTPSKSSKQRAHKASKSAKKETGKRLKKLSSTKKGKS
jgi:hypothetical protein